MVLKPPIRVLTPPIGKPFAQTAKQTQKETQKTPTGAAQPAASGTATALPSFESIFGEMLKRYLPETVTFTPIGEDVLKETIRNWIRPAYEQAIRDRQQRTERQNAELDADAWARGIGASTYVTDVKDRAYRSEARDVSDLESDYASTLAGHLYDAMRAQQEKKIEVDRFNAEQINRAREKAAAAAQTLYASYQSAAKSGGSGGSRASAKTAQPKSTLTNPALLSASPQPSAPTVDYKAAANLLARLNPAQRSQLYVGKGGYALSNAEILQSLGKDTYQRLKKEFPAS